MRTEHERWLALTAEEALEPALPICDPHHHLWRALSESTIPVKRYLLEELFSDLGAGHLVSSTVYVECGSNYRREGPAELRPVGETEFVEANVRQRAAGPYGSTAVAAGIVGFADLTLGERVTEVLEAHLLASPTRFRGVRQACAWDAHPDIRSYGNPPPGRLADRNFRAAFGRLQSYDLSFDAWIYHPQLAELADLAAAFPRVTIILDHVGGPLGLFHYADHRAEVFQIWKNSIAALAAHPNVVIKLGGFGMPLYGFGWERRHRPPGSAELAEAIRPYVEWCIERFGVGRCMFESNFPVDKTSFSYTVLWNAFKRLTTGFSAAERAALFHDNASRLYRLPPAPTS